MLQRSGISANGTSSSMLTQTGDRVATFMIYVSWRQLITYLTISHTIWTFLPRDAIYIMRCLSVCVSVTFVHSVETNKHILIFLQLATQTVLPFPYQTLWQYSDGDPHTNGDVEYRWGRRFSANIWLYRVLLTVQLRSAIHSATTKHDKLLRLVAGKRRRLFLTGDDDEVFMTRSQSTLRRREHSSI